MSEFREPPPEAILFDLGGVLMDFSGLQRLAELTGEDNDAAFGERWGRSPWLQAFERGHCTATEFAAGVVGDWDLELTPEEFLLEFANWPAGPFEGAVELVRHLYGKVPMGCLSNTNPIHWQAHLDRWEIVRYFEWTFVSYELGMMKPDPDLYDYVLGEVGVAAGRLLFLDDCDEHVIAARERGIRSHAVVGLEAVRASIAKHLPLIKTPPFR